MMKQTDTPGGRMEAIAGGVRARLEVRTGFSRRLASETVEAARALGVGDREIERWFQERQRLLAVEEERIWNITRRINGNQGI
jgi:hypothetical protein